MQTIRQKLTSRKLWMAVGGFVSCLVVAFNGSAELAETVVGCIMAGATVIAYILGEGLIDSAEAAAQSRAHHEGEEK